MKKYIPLMLVGLIAGCASDKSMQSYYLDKATAAANKGNCKSALAELSKFNGRTDPSDENAASALLIESSCYLEGDNPNISYAKGSYEHLAEKYPDTKAGHIAESFLADWDNNVADKK